MEMMDIVNEKDEVIGTALREEIYKRLLTHRIVHIFVFNNRRELAMHKRAKGVSFCPDHWDSSAAGHVKSGEDARSAAIRELKEELGISSSVEYFSKDIYTDNFRGTGLKKVLITFKSIYNGPFKINPEEVQIVEFFSLDKIQKMIDAGEKFHPELLFLLRKHFGVK